ncbi:unnamed protein product [Soboliphyme baturini]|uniref:non-specific serine/threonine protein kinase n=1 Tax=Soboliphyme baturini TaxID=241478 RepID=A0A183IEN9_9BILA|nr:unnamed protein product [Soboliphyme baturini]
MSLLSLLSSSPVYKPKLHTTCDTRRWSVASLPSSGYETPGSSAFSSQYSSQERITTALDELKLSSCGSMDIGSFFDEKAYSSSFSPVIRWRSRSLSGNCGTCLHDPVEISFRNNLYKAKFPKAKKEMEERLEKFIFENNVHPCFDARVNGDDSCRLGKTAFLAVTAAAAEKSPNLVKLFSDGSASFVHYQIIEIACTCLQKCREDQISSDYFMEMSNNLDSILAQAKEKCPDSYDQLRSLATKLLIIVSRSARLLECLEFDPNEFYQMLEKAEDLAREAKHITDIPMYIISKLGLDKAHISVFERHLMLIVHTDLTYDSDGRHQLLEDRPESGRHKMSSSTQKVTKVSHDREAEAKASSVKVSTAAKRVLKEDDFDTIKLISNGAYGAVYLVRAKDTRQRFALKKLNKANLMLRKQIDQVYAERDILTFADNPFVVSFYGSFETKASFCVIKKLYDDLYVLQPIKVDILCRFHFQMHLCLLLEFVEGGDCATLLKHVGTFPVEIAQRYIAETVLAIDYLHSYGIVHRDLKPDNLLITTMGHIKLTDFGLSKIGLMNRTVILCEDYFDVSDTQQFQDRQICGTPEYIAPEVILRQGYGRPVDWWALGIILYEFLVGTVPFFGSTPEELFAHVINDRIEWPEEPYRPSSEAESLITGLLKISPIERLGTIGGALEVKMHPFFTTVDWDSLLRQKAEFIPQLENDEDTSYFDSTYFAHVVFFCFWCGMPEHTARLDRFNHEIDSGEECWSENSSSIFSSFSSCSPRYSFLADHTILKSADGQDTALSCSESNTDNGYPLYAENGRGGRGNSQTSSQGSGRTTSSLSDSCDLPYHDGISSAGAVTTADLQSSLPDFGQKEGGHSYGGSRDLNRVKGELPKLSVSFDTDDAEDPLAKELSPVNETVMDGGSRTRSSSSVAVRPLSPATAIAKMPQQLLYRHPSLTRQRQSPRQKISQGLHLIIPESLMLMPAVQSPGASSNSSIEGSSSRSDSFDISPLINSVKPTIALRRGYKGFGFSFRSIRVYLGHTDYYTIQHIITVFFLLIRLSCILFINDYMFYVDPKSSAFEAGLRPDDLITSINGCHVQNSTQSEVLHKLICGGEWLTLRVCPLDQTSIKIGKARKSVGKLVRRRGGGRRKVQQRRALDKKSKGSLFRRLSGKRVSAEFITTHNPAQSLHRSVSNAEGLAAVRPEGTTVPALTIAPAVCSCLSTTSGTYLSPSSVRSRCFSCHLPVPFVSESALSFGHPTPSPMATVNITTPPSPTIVKSPITSSRPSSFHGLKHKIVKTLKSPRRKQTQAIPLSPLARSDQSSSTLPNDPAVQSSPQHNAERALSGGGSVASHATLNARSCYEFPVILPKPTSTIGSAASSISPTQSVECRTSKEAGSVYNPKSKTVLSTNLVLR